MRGQLQADISTMLGNTSVPLARARNKQNVRSMSLLCTLFAILGAVLCRTRFGQTIVIGITATVLALAVTGKMDSATMAVLFASLDIREYSRSIPQQVHRTSRTMQFGSVSLSMPLLTLYIPRAVISARIGSTAGTGVKTATLQLRSRGMRS